MCSCMHSALDREDCAEDTIRFAERSGYITAVASALPVSFKGVPMRCVDGEVYQNPTRLFFFSNSVH